MNLASKLSDLRQQMLRLEYEGDEKGKVIARHSQALLNDAVAELNALADDLEALIKKYSG